jgi:thymidylate synthase ThyX
MISAKVVADSFNETGDRLITLSLRYPRFIHAEFMTHRVFSRNASSSRAIPVEKMLKMVREEPAMPIHWGMNQPGMQAYKEVGVTEQRIAKDEWCRAAESAVVHATHLMGLGIHKQVINRLLEPFQHISVVVTATEWENFFLLRMHETAEPNIQALAWAMKQAIEVSTPRSLEWGGWHMPYVEEWETHDLDIDTQVKCSVARCARVSYMNHEGKAPETAKDEELYDRLVGSTPIHASPTEHQALAYRGSRARGMSGNFKGGWVQHRKLLEAGILPSHFVALGVDFS